MVRSSRAEFPIPNRPRLKGKTVSSTYMEPPFAQQMGEQLRRLRLEPAKLSLYYCN